MGDMSQKDGEHLIEPVKPTKKTKKTRRRLSYNPQFIKMVSRLVAAGHDAADIAFLIGVKKATIEQWKHRYPVFRKAWDEGKKIAGSYLIATGLKLCEGYEIEEETLKLAWNKIEEKWENSEKKIVKKYVQPNAALIQFFLSKLCPDVFGKSEDVEQLPRKQITSTANDINKLAGKLTELSSTEGALETEFVDEEDSLEAE